MHTLSLFPSLLTFGIFAPFILRLIASYFLIYTGIKVYKDRQNNWLAFPYILSGAILFFGIYTQGIVLLALITIKINWWMNRKISSPSNEQMMLYWFAGIILLSLLLTGPGAFAIDYPL